MDGSAFDRLSRAFVTAGSRRGLLSLLGSLPLAGFLVASSDTSAKRGRGRRRDHARSQRRKSHHKEAHASSCIPTGQRCPAKKPRGKHGKKLGCNKCCQGSTVTDASGMRLCGCLPTGESCTMATAASCCSGFCSGSTCQAAPCSAATPCPPCQTCNAQTALCEPAADGVTCAGSAPCTTGTCQSGVCVVTPMICPAGQTCQDGVCGVKCGSNFCQEATEICVGNSCQPCTVTCNEPDRACDGAALEAAVNAAGTAPIYVCAGTYTGRYTFNPVQAKTVIGAGQGDDPAADTILDGELQGTVVTVPDGVTLTLRRLRITRGQVTDDLEAAGGITQRGASLTMTDCTVTDNHTGGESPGNAFRGGGILSSFGQLVMTGCTVSSNTVANSANGGLGTDFAQGGGIYITLSSLILTDCVIAGNTARDSGGGLYVDRTRATLASCQVTGNILTQPSPEGGSGIRKNLGMDMLQLINSFVWDNTPPLTNCSGAFLTDPPGTGCNQAPPV